jgi:predicted amidohydrolase/isopentenyldiphosphate isomerase
VTAELPDRSDVTQQLPVAVIQHDIVWEDAAATLARVSPLVTRAAREGARLVVLPEMFATGFSPRTEVIVEDEGGPAGTFLVDQARANDVWMLGSICERDPRGGLPRNVAVLAGPDGRTHRYAKRHLFSYAGEHRRLGAGQRPVLVDVDEVRASLHVCYDLRFAPDFWPSAPAVDLYLVPANWPTARIAHWRALLVARAVENQAYVVGANRIGSGGNLDYPGDSLIVDPLGEVLADGAGGTEQVLHAVIDPARVRDVRLRYPFLADRALPGDPGDEPVDVLDADGRVEAVVTRREMRAGRLRHRCTFVVVRSSAGEVLVHRRSPHKDMWPDRWDLCAGGVVSAGEGWEDAAVRELSEELGIHVAHSELGDLGDGEATYVDDDVDEVARIWSITCDGPFTFADGEVVEARFVSLDELARMLEAEPFVADSVALVAPLLIQAQ